MMELYGYSILLFGILENAPADFIEEWGLACREYRIINYFH